MIKDTIAAISTPMSNSGIGIVRMSGEDSFRIIDKIYRSKKGDKKISLSKSHTIHYGYIVDEDIIIDEVLVMVMRGPGTFTAEDTIEINCHGGVFVMNTILQTVIKYGVRPAEPGEFTKRAFLNGRIDLSQAEAVIDVINSKNNYALQSSISQLKGSILNIIKEVRAKIIYHIAYIESALDDPEHISIDGYGEELMIDTRKNIVILTKLLNSADNGRIMKEGIKTVILGKPNAGKSSLLNLLAGEERAIVTDIAGTTRDILEESINLDGISLNVIDTAGIRDTQDVIEKIGVSKAKEYAKSADLIIYVVDSSNHLDENDEQIIKILKNKKVIILLNKIDLESVTVEESIKSFIDKPVVPISAKNNIGIDELSRVLKEMFYKGDVSFNDEVYLTNVRHKTAISEALKSLEMVKLSIQNQMPEDFFTIDLMNAYESLGSIIGESVGEELVNEIFNKFCTGK